MMKRIAMALALVVGATSSASGQAQVTARASVPAIVDEAGAARELIFPAGAPGGTGGIAANGSMVGASAAGQLGYQDYRLNYSGPTVSVPGALTLSSTATPANQISATITCAQAAQAAASVTLADCTGGVALTHSGPGMSLRRVFVGGSISQAAIDAAVPASDYTGTITILLTP